ncbi:Hsp33 family molecular chaperone HslO [Stenotrophomonas sp. MMGLT7]|uniref:Hsp33 family molecular chaperone HslO n=1 Tax=Stenotrophomonas sp. MMGLT7 TaxID=2901227 RepID=UPI001E60CE08|nr:Hsp33 family molecular chaperone HslO [Stenotrophomonas sp. MMGLT7]MCD7100061.1 Hsp33 family molecular chaperone HslO [Stenotrophomonas sp. MMGLT7]
MKDHDQLQRFLLPDAGVRGIHVDLHDTWTGLLSHAAYPPAIQELLGEACAAASLFTGHTKIDGRLSVQIRSRHPGLRTLFAECTAAGTVRGIVQGGDEAPLPRDLRQLGEDALLAITIENPGLDPREPQRYQSLVALDSTTLGEAFENYFRQSEQLPTRLLLAADGQRATGLLLQKLPGDGGDADGWNRACALFDTLGEKELLELPGSRLVHRLFHEESPQVLGGRPLAFGCSCSRERVAAMLQSLGEDEARAAAAATGAVEVRCEFCGQRYDFPLSELPALFSQPAAAHPAPEHLQ